MRRSPLDPPNRRIRLKLAALCPTVADLDAFCLDAFGKVHRQFAPGMTRSQREDLLLTSADPDDLAAALGLTPERERERERDPLFARVLAATKLRDRRRQDPSSVEEPLVRSLATTPLVRGLAEASYLMNGLTVRHGVALVTQALTDAQVPLLCEAFEAHALLSGAVMPSEVVYKDWTPSAAFKAACGTRRVTVFSLDEYEGLIDFSRLVQKQSLSLAHSVDYPPSLYVDQRLDICEDGSFDFTRLPASPSAIDQVMAWLEDASRARFVLLIGDFGHGKTFLLRELCRRMGEAGGPLVPLFCELRTLEKVSTLEGLLMHYLSHHREHLRHADPDSLLHMLALGRVVVFFDGFDELALRTTYDRAAEHLNTLLQAVSPPGSLAKVVLTSRTQHFLSDHHLAHDLTTATRTVLGDRLLHVPMGIGRLPPFDPAQIRQFLKNRLHSDEKADERLALIDEIKDLLGLSKNPRLLSFIAALPEADLRAATKKTGEVTAAGLYQALLDRWLLRESERTDTGAVAIPQAVAARYAALTDLALRLWRQTDRTASVEDLAAESRQHLHDLSAAEAAHEVGTRTLLTRDAAGRFSFFHESILEWLVARAAADELRQHKSDLLARAELSDLLCEFLHGHAGADRVIAWAEDTLLSHDAELGPSAPIRKHNAQAVLRRLKRELPACQQFMGHDLHARDLSHQRFVGADFTGANLRGAKLYKTDLRRADLTRADLSGADLMGADLRGAVLQETNLSRARMIGARFDPNALATLDQRLLWGSAGPACSLPDQMVAQRWSGNALAFSPDGSLLALAAGSAIVLLCTQTSTPLRVLAGHGNRITSVAFSPDGQTLASGAWDNTVRIWEVHSGLPSLTLCGHDTPVTCVAFSPNGLTLASGAYDQTVGIWETQSGVPRLTLHGHDQVVTCVAFSPDGRTLASGAYDQTVRIWDANSGLPRLTLRGHDQPVTCVAFSPDGRTLASGSWDHTVRIWEANSGLPRLTLRGHDKPINSVAFSPDGLTLASGAYDKAVRIWNAQSGLPRLTLRGHDDRVTCVVFSPDGMTLASAASDYTVRIWEANSGLPRLTLRGHDKPINSVAFSPDGLTLASGAYDKAVRIWNAQSGLPRLTLRGHDARVTCVVFSPDGRTLASGSWDNTVRIWEANSGLPRLPLRGHDNWVTCLAFSPDGLTLASGASDHTVRIWEANSGLPRLTLRGHDRPVTSVSFSPDGLTLASGAWDHTVRIWKANSGHPHLTLGGHEHRVTSVAFSPDGLTLASGASDHTVRIWDTKSGLPHLTLRGHAQPVNSVSFSPDGLTLASGADDNTVRIWDTQTGQCRAVLLATSTGWAVLLRDGRYKQVGNVDGLFWHTIGLCRFEPGELDEFMPGLRVADDQPLDALPPWVPPTPAEPLASR